MSHESPLPERVCQICRTTLDVRADAVFGVVTNAYYSHPPAYEQLGFPEHEPVPVEPGPGDERVGICDFCSGQHPVWRYPVTDFDVKYGQHVSHPERFGVPYMSTSIGDWAACERCHTLIETDNYRELCERAVRNGLGKDMHSMAAAKLFTIRKSIKGLHQRFREHRVGEAYPV